MAGEDLVCGFLQNRSPVPSGRKRESTSSPRGIIACNDANLNKRHPTSKNECQPRIATVLAELRGLARSGAAAPGVYNVARTSYARRQSPVGSVALATFGLATSEANSEQTGRSVSRRFPHDSFLAAFAQGRIAGFRGSQSVSDLRSSNHVPSLSRQNGLLIADHRQFTFAPSFPDSVASHG